MKLQGKKKELLQPIWGKDRREWEMRRRGREKRREKRYCSAS